MGYSRAEIVGLLLRAFLPFNVIKGGLNAAITMLLYKPVVTALRQSGLIEAAPDVKKVRINAGVVLTALITIVMCVLFILYLNQ